jgi:hypothetical protein
MKKKTLSLTKKLLLDKATISHLNSQEQQHAVGGKKPVTDEPICIRTSVANNCTGAAAL